MKKKPLNKTTLKDLMAVTDEPSGSSAPQDLSTYSFYTEDTVKEIQEYNTNLVNLDEDFTKLKPITKLLVRVFLKEPRRTKEGLIIPNTEMVKKPTHSGYGSIAEVESPFPYSQKAIVVSVPSYVKDIQVGDVVLLNSKQVKPEVLGSGQEAVLNVPNAFIHPEFGSELTADISNKTYGYLKINYNDIDFKL